MAAEDAPVVWEGDSRAVLREFPEDVREDLGLDLWRVQNGLPPLDSGSMAPALPGVFELRDRDKDCWYRVLYIRIGNVIYVLHSFRKKTNETPQRDIRTAEQRLKNVRQRLAVTEREKKYGDRKHE